MTYFFFKVKEKISVTPEEDFGLQTYDLKEVAGGIPRENADSFRALASGKVFSFLFHFFFFFSFLPSPMKFHSFF